MASVLGLTSLKVDDLVSYLSDLNAQIGLPGKLREIGVTSDHIETLADLAFADFCHPNNPKPVTRADFKRLYEEAL
jgi:alcohol dehydrogenase class IV